MYAESRKESLSELFFLAKGKELLESSNERKIPGVVGNGGIWKW